ncbi:hypothetical protein BC827DRAFT_915910 [Russula dissimulans]|nr:hypothetical protein BC827DRAFT_915910 [Russula dissimulans]
MSSAANQTHEVHRGDIPYQAPFARSASPNDSLTTAYEADDTNVSDAELSDDAFSNKVLDSLRIYKKREEEERAEVRPLIMPRPRHGSGQTEPDEGAMHFQVMRSLNWHVAELESEETIEAALQRQLKGVVETQPCVDAIMESVM